MNKKCECGCGIIIPALTKEGKPARFKNGHNLVGKFGEHHHKWIGETTKTRTSLERARNILKRSGITECQAKNEHCKGRLETHHIDKNELNNDQKNLLLLCKSHHHLADFRMLSLSDLKRLNPVYVICKGEKSYGRKMYRDGKKRRSFQ